jgi:hypothetical protein
LGWPCCYESIDRTDGRTKPRRNRITGTIVVVLSLAAQGELTFVDDATR